MKSIYVYLFFVITLCFAKTEKKSGLTFYVALQQNTEGVKFLERYILDFSSNTKSSLYGKHLTTEEICSLTSTSDTHFHKVINWFSDRKIKCIRQCDALKCNGHVRHINNALKTDISLREDFTTGRLKLYSLVSYTIPDELKESIVFIDGLSNSVYSNLLKYNKPKNINGQSIDNSVVSREVLQRLYNLSDTMVNSKISVGAMEYMGGNGFSNDDLQIDQVYNGVTKNPIQPDHILGINNYKDGESTLDVQVMYWAASGATLWYEDFNGGNHGWMYSWANDFLNRTDYPHVVSLSWGWDERYQCSITKCTHETSKQYVDRTNIEFMKIVARGTTIVVASGDAGSPGRTNELCDSNKGPYGWNHINPIFPGASPWVLSVGATYILPSMNKLKFNTPICTNVSGITCSSGNIEQMVSYNNVQWTSGAGTSLFSQTPKWQQDVVNKYLSKRISFPDQQYFNKNGRFYPDVSAFGHNCVIYNGNDGWGSEDGTSCASPIFAGIIAQLNNVQLSKNKPLLGFVNPLLYKMYNESPLTFHDITVGNSTCTEAMCCGKQYGFLATDGWDIVSGLGTPNVGLIIEYLNKNT